MRYRGYTIKQSGKSWIIYKGTEILKTGALSSDREARAYIDRLIGTPNKAY
jgi:hypothetical protein